MSYTALNITEEDRVKLINMFQPKYTDVICHHVTIRMGTKLPLPEIYTVQIIGYIDGEGTDVPGIEAFIVAVDGVTERPIGGMYHITHSLSEPRKPFDSNKLIAQKEFEKLSNPITINVIPTYNHD